MAKIINAESNCSSESISIDFIVRDAAVKVLYRNEFRNIAYLDLSEIEKLVLESSSFNVSMTIDSNNISIYDRFDRLNQPEEISNKNQQPTDPQSFFENFGI